MNSMLTDSTRRAAACAMGLALVAGIFVACAAWGQERHDGHGRAVHEPYRTPHMFFDNRYGHGHYYPVVGYSVRALPPGYLSIGFGNRRFFFHGGVWFQPAVGGFVVVRPPVGVVVPVLPLAYATVWVGGAPYYYANNEYYVEAPGGYAVAAPPPGVTQGAAPQAPSAPPAPEQAPFVPAAPAPQQAPAALQQVPAAPPASALPQAAASVWHYCESSKSYYPYVTECKEGWRTVPAAPPGAR
jgi:Family of unknown function (DUF6515)